ncbi:UNVERIFIED_CONTAM: hypothetical protein Slati_1486800 [Sesamum latifolium]|uniref:Uncharacterized protein n=1 Tax=Sesamum latifolium TaxID=2727402 RepID=A0AAW2X621_9LAMI
MIIGKGRIPPTSLGEEEKAELWSASPLAEGPSLGVGQMASLRLLEAPGRYWPAVSLGTGRGRRPTRHYCRRSWSFLAAPRATLGAP